MKFTHNFNQDLDILLNEVGKKPFAFTRFADGEHAVLEGKPIQGYDWFMEPSYDLSKLDINAALNYRHPRYYYGISCACCDQEKATYYKAKLTDCMQQVTYSNIFANGNYQKSKSWLESLDSLNLNPWLLVNDKAYNKSFPFKANKTYFSSNILATYETKPYVINYQVSDIARNTNNQLVLVAVGPMSEILIHKLWKLNDSNYYIDIGSIVDPYIHGDTRIYHHHPHWKTLNCTNL